MKFLFAASFWILLLAAACKNDDISFAAPSQDLRFSHDTVFCDTVYNQVRSETYAVKVYNREDQDVMIPEITLAGGSASQYRINVDGRAGTQFRNVPLRKKDSLFIFVEVAPVANATQAIAEDKILFKTAAKTQSVTLFSVVQDAEFYIQSATNPNILGSNTNWTNSRAKVIFGKLTVADGKTLSIQKGTKVYFTKNSSLALGKNATLNVAGDLGSEVVFRGDRNDTRYDTIPLNWKGISAQSGAVLNINYAKIFGGETGLRLNNATAKISNSIIHTFQNFGIQSIGSAITAENMVMNNCGEADLGISKGGTASLTHCTLANYWKLNSALPGYSLFATNEYKNEAGATENAALSLNIKNTILYGSQDNAIFFKPTTGQSFNYQITNSLLKTGSNAGFVFEGNPAIVSSIKNSDPKFVNYFTQKMNLRVKADSPVKNKGIFIPTLGADIAGTPRSNPPSIGAYQ